MIGGINPRFASLPTTGCDRDSLISGNLECVDGIRNRLQWDYPRIRCTTVTRSAKNGLHPRGWSSPTLILGQAKQFFSRHKIESVAQFDLRAGNLCTTFLHEADMHPDHSIPTIPCSILPMHLSSRSYTLDGAVGDTYLPPTRAKLVPNVDPTCPGKGESDPSLQESFSESCAFGDSLRRTSEPSQVKHPSVTYTPSNTTWETELEEVREIQGVNCPLAQCLYPGVQGKRFCLENISSATIPDHFISHGIENKSRKEVIHCQWNGCCKKVTRHAFVRHIREVHLGHKRRTSVHPLKKDPR